MLVKWSDSNHILPLTPISSFRPLDPIMVTAVMSNGQPVATSQFPTQVTMYFSVTASNPVVMITRTNPGEVPPHLSWMGVVSTEGLIWLQLRSSPNRVSVNHSCYAPGVRSDVTQDSAIKLSWCGYRNW